MKTKAQKLLETLSFNSGLSHNSDTKPESFVWKVESLYKEKGAWHITCDTVKAQTLLEAINVWLNAKVKHDVKNLVSVKGY